jgi:hypothetical protein
MLERPKLDRLVFTIFPEMKDYVESGLCPSCGKPINEEDFVDEISKEEYSIVGLCQKCQDKILKTGVQNEEDY